MFDVWLVVNEVTGVEARVGTRLSAAERDKMVAEFAELGEKVRTEVHLGE